MSSSMGGEAGRAEPLVRNVSDTARWVAVYRAQESTRPDALFHDPYAARLAGDRGRAIATRAPRRARHNGWAVVARTVAIDQLVAASLAEGCDRVVNLAAGLDTRPYRMALPASLEWTEADLDPLIEEKSAILAGEQARCRLRREAVDLRDDVSRDAFLARAVAGASHALVLTEGLLGYLEEGAVRSLARTLHARPEIRWWMMDLAAPAMLRMFRAQMGRYLANAPMRFAPDDGVAFFERLGWRALEVRSLRREAARFGRLPLSLRLGALLPDPDPRHPGRARWMAVARFVRA